MAHHKPDGGVIKHSTPTRNTARVEGDWVRHPDYPTLPCKGGAQVYGTIRVGEQVWGRWVVVKEGK